MSAVEADQPFGEVERTSSRLGAEEGTTAVALDKEELPRATRTALCRRQHSRALKMLLANQSCRHQLAIMAEEEDRRHREEHQVVVDHQEPSTREEAEPKLEVVEDSLEEEQVLMLVAVAHRIWAC